MERLKQLRKDKKLTQDKVASILGISRAAYNAYELGTRQPDPNMLKALGDLYEVSVDYLLGRTDELSLTKKPDKQATVSSSRMTKMEYLKLLVRSDEFNSLSLKARLVHFYCVINSDGRFILDLRLTQKAIGATEKDIQQLIESEYIVEEVPYVWAINAEVI